MLENSGHLFFYKVLKLGSICKGVAIDKAEDIMHRLIINIQKGYKMRSDLTAQEMALSLLENEIAQKVCSIGNHIIANNLPVEVIESGCDEIEQDKNKLIDLLYKYRGEDNFNIPLFNYVMKNEIDSVVKNEELQKTYIENENRLPLYFGVIVMNQLRIDNFPNHYQKVNFKP